VLYLYHVEGVSLVLISLMTELSLSTVKSVVDKASREYVKHKEKAAARLPSSKGPVERQIHTLLYDNLSVIKLTSPQEPPPRRRSRRERRHDRA
jgi:hypothetical protein